MPRNALNWIQLTEIVPNLDNQFFQCKVIHSPKYLSYSPIGEGNFRHCIYPCVNSICLWLKMALWSVKLTRLMKKLFESVVLLLAHPTYISSKIAFRHLAHRWVKFTPLMKRICWVNLTQLCTHLEYFLLTFKSLT